MKALSAGVAYFAGVFAVGFVLGALRIFVLVPEIGEALAVIVETPVILTACWVICGWLIRRMQISETVGARLTMGVTAFGLLIAAEAALSIAGFGQSSEEFFASYATTAGAIGLAGQIAFGLFPLIRIWLRAP